MSTVNVRQLSRETKSVIEEVLRTGRPAIVTVSGRPQVAVIPLVGAVEAAEEHLLRNAPLHIQAAVRQGEADLISGRVTVDESHFSGLGEESAEFPSNLTAAALQDQLPVVQGLEDVLASAHGDPEKSSLIRQALAEVHVYALGMPAGDIQAPGVRTESDLLHFTIDDEDGHEAVPVFTRPEVARVALGRKPDWRSLYVMQISGRELLENIDANVTTIINPWSDLEFRIPPRTPSHHTYIAEPLVPAAELVSA